MIDIQIRKEALSELACLDLVRDGGAGGTVVFSGTVRNQTNGKEVIRLDFEAYEPMAIREMQKIASDIMEKWPVLHVVIHHRTGNLEIGEIPVIICVAAAHRKAAFAACEYAIDTLKKTVPIWKKEIFRDGEVWVSAHP